MRISSAHYAALGLAIAGVAGLSAIGLGSGCFSNEPSSGQVARHHQQESAAPIVATPALPPGQYDLQSVTYDDATGMYKIFVLNVPPGHKPLFESQDVRMARLDDDAISAGKKSYLEFKDGPPTLYLTSDFQIAFVHNVAEERPTESGQHETVIVRQETTSWSPFMSGMAGAAIGSMLFAPRYYYPPPYYGGGGLIGFGGVGQSRALAGQDYSTRFGHEPQSARLSRSGVAPRRVSPTSLRPSGSGAGSSRLKPSSPGYRPPVRRPGVGFGRRR